MSTSVITVAEPFRKRSPLRELAEYFLQGRLNREDYIRHRQHLIDYLCGLESQPDPLVLMLIRQSESALHVAIDITEPQDRPPSKTAPDISGVTAAVAKVVTPRAPTEVRQAVQVPSPDDDDASVTRVMGVRPVEQPGLAVKKTGERSQQEDLPRLATPVRLIVVAAVLCVVVVLGLILWLN